MPTYTIKAPNGRTYSIPGPAGATLQQVQQQILAAHPEAAQRQILTVRPPQTQAQPQSSIGGTLWRAAQDAIPGINYLQAIRQTPGTPANYSDRVALAAQQRTQQEMVDAQQHPWLHYGGELASGIAGTIAGGAAIKGGAAAMAAADAPRVAQVGNVLQNLGNIKKGQTATNIAKTATVGAATGAAYGAGSSDPNRAGEAALEGAATGAVLAPAIGGAASRWIAPAAGSLVRGAQRLAGNLDPSIANAMQGAIKEAPEAIAQRGAALSAKTGSQVPLVAALNPQDFANVSENIIKKSPEAVTAAQNQTGKAIGDFQNRMLDHVTTAGQAADSGPAMNTSVGNLKDLRNQTANDAMEPIRGQQIDLSQISLPPEVAPFVRQFSGISSDIPGQPSLGRRMAAALGNSNATIPANWGTRDTIPATLNEMETLRQSLMSAANHPNTNAIDAKNLRGAAQSVSDYTNSQLPNDVSDAYKNMLSTYQKQSQMINGFETAAGGQTASDVQNDNIRADLGTPEGKNGLAAGELYRQRQSVAASPTSAINAAKNFAAEGALTRPASIDPNAPNPGTVTTNLGDQSAAGLANASDGENQVLSRMLDTDSLNQVTKNEQGTLSPADIVHAAVFPHAFAGTKASWIMQAINKATGVNPKVAENIANMLYSSDPSAQTTAMNALQVSGMSKDAIAAMMGAAPDTSGASSTIAGMPLPGNFPTTAATSPSTVLGAAAANQTAQTFQQPNPQAPPGQQLVGQGMNADGTPYPQYGTATPDPSTTPPADPNAPPVAPTAAPQPSADPNTPPAAAPVATGTGPYSAILSNVMNAADPKTLALATTIYNKESRGNQFDKNGNPLTSPKGAIGGMQLEPKTAQDVAKSIGVPYDAHALAYDPDYNTLLGMGYTHQMLQQFGGDSQKAAAAYNAGPGATQLAINQDPTGWLGRLSAETQNYAGDITP